MAKGSRSISIWREWDDAAYAADSLLALQQHVSLYGNQARIQPGNRSALRHVDMHASATLINRRAVSSSLVVKIGVRLAEHSCSCCCTCHNLERQEL